MSTNKTVTAIFDNRQNALDAVGSLEGLGYNKENISLLVAENSWNGHKDI